VGVDAAANDPQLVQRPRYSLCLPERTNPGLIEPSGGTAARCLWASSISGFHTSSEVMNDLPKLHGSQGMGGQTVLDARSDPPITSFRTGAGRVASALLGLTVAVHRRPLASGALAAFVAARPNRISSSDRGRPDRFKLDQHP